jgi:hypothetical protein
MIMVVYTTRERGKKGCESGGVHQVVGEGV